MMNTPRLSKTGIEYGDLGWNFYSGCRHKEKGICPPDIPCWAAEHVKRFHDYYPNGFAPTFYPEAFLSPLRVKKPSRILVCFMGDLFGEWNSPSIMVASPKSPYGKDIRVKTFEIINACPQHTFIFLTKNPRGMIPWSPFPEKSEVGFTATNPDEFVARLREITKVEARVKWCSLEPLLDWNSCVADNAFELLDWVAIGGLTGRKDQIMKLAGRYPKLTPFKLSAKGNRWGLMPPVAWLKNIVEGLDACGTKVFIKDNLGRWLCEYPYDELFWTFGESAVIDKDLSHVIVHLRQECGALEGRPESLPIINKGKER